MVWLVTSIDKLHGKGIAKHTDMLEARSEKVSITINTTD
jgi:hypothetical protein